MHENLNAAVEMIVECFKNGGKLLICGNGGSGADSAHILGELVKGFMLRRPLNRDLIDRIGEPWAEKLQRGLPAIDLTANCALIGAVANDHVAKLKDIGRREFLMLAVLAAFTMLMGLYPKPFTDVMHVSVENLLSHVAQSKLPLAQ